MKNQQSALVGEREHRNCRQNRVGVQQEMERERICCAEFRLAQKRGNNGSRRAREPEED